MLHYNTRPNSLKISGCKTKVTLCYYLIGQIRVGTIALNENVCKNALSNIIIIDLVMTSCQLSKREFDQLPNRECRRMTHAILGPFVLVTEKSHYKVRKQLTLRHAKPEWCKKNLKFPFIITVKRALHREETARATQSL